MRLHLIGSDDEIAAYVEMDDGAMCCLYDVAYEEITQGRSVA